MLALGADRWRSAADAAALRALSDQDRDPFSPTRGCFDRRYWAWKLVDCPEATFQRHVGPLAALVQDSSSVFHNRADVVDAIAAGLRFAATIQHRNGSFDQAFPFEQSWGATAFVLEPLLSAMELSSATLGAGAAGVAERLAAGASFLQRHRERHGTITNHLAGGASALYAAGRTLRDSGFTAAADALLDEVLVMQSAEGWFPEYDGADPGYQTLCLQYLAGIYIKSPSPALRAALARSLEFLQWFVHPDGTMGGVYGSRRTRLIYPGGFALLAGEFPIAAAILRATEGAALQQLSTVDAGNLAPMLTSVVAGLACPAAVTPAGGAYVLPAERQTAAVDFADAGLHVRVTPAYSAVVGAANGGTLTVFDRAGKTRAREDGGYVAVLDDGRTATSQVTERRTSRFDAGSIAVRSVFRVMDHRPPTPVQFVVFRLLNLTVMRSLRIGNIVKRFIVGRLMRAHDRVDLAVERRFEFQDRVRLSDTFENKGGLVIRSLEGGVAFNSIHMASAGYYDSADLRQPSAAVVTLDAAALTRDRTLAYVERVP